MTMNQYDDQYQPEEMIDQEQEQEQSNIQENNQLEQCQQEVALWKDQAARIFADFENYKKRMDREQMSWMQTAQVSVLKDLLTVVDNFDRALSAKTDATADMYAGIEMIYKSVMQLLHKYGVQEFVSYDQFNPEFHEALMEVASEQHTTGQVVQVLEKGFMIKDKVLRPAKVMVAK